LAIGTPEKIEFGQSLSKGIISGIRKTNNLDFIQTTAKINIGNSGGALTSKKNGALIGIINTKLLGVGIEDLGFATPASKIKKGLNITFK